MTSFDDRENAFERKYANDQETLFRIEARACKLLGLWAAQEMGLTGADADSYAGTVVSANLKAPGTADVVEKVSQDMSAKGKDAGSVAAMMMRFMKDAETQIRTA